MRLLAFFNLFLTLVLCVAPGEILSEESPESADLGDVVVRDQADTESTLKPSSFATVLYPEQYSDELVTLPELLSRQTGVFVKSFGGLGQLSTVSIRGSTAEQVSVYVDGIKINTAQGGAVDFSTLPLGSIDRIEILRGGASSQFGSDAIGGVISIVTKKAGPKPSLELRYSQGSFFTIETHAGFAKRFGKFGLTLDHTHLSSDGDFSFVTTGVQFAGGGEIGGDQTFTRLHNNFFSEGLLTRLDRDIGPNGRFTFTNDAFYTSRNLPGSELETTQLFPANPLDAHENLFRNAAGVQLAWEKWLHPNLNFYLTPNYRVEWSHFTDATPAFGPPIDVSYLNQGVGVKPKWTYSLDCAAHRHLFTLLYDFRYDRFSSSSPLPDVKRIGTHDRVVNAIFVQDEISLVDDKLYLNPSVRWEDASDFGNNFAGHFGIIGRPASWVSLKANVENSFRFPSFNELYFPDQGFIRGNPGLEEEKAFNVDAGVNFHGERYEVELAYFRNLIDNSIVFVPISAFTIAPVNSGPVTAQGFEGTVKLYPVRFLELTGNYTFLDAVVDASGNQLPGRPRHMANGRIEFNWKYGSLFSQVQYIDRLFLDFSNTRFLSQRAIVDVGGTFKWKEKYFVTLQGKNIGNVQAFDSVGYPLPRAQVYFSFGYKS